MRKTVFSQLARILNPSVIGIVILSLIALGVYSYRINQESIWNDEWFTVNVIDQPNVSAMLKEVVHTENNPPLYYMLLRIWSGNGAYLSMEHLRFFSVMLAVVCVALIFVLANMLYGYRVGIVASICASVSPYLCWYAQEVRNLTLFALLAVLSMITFYSYAKRPGRITRLVLALAVMVLGVYTHYFFLFLIPAQLIYAWCFDDGRLFKRWFFGLIIVGTVFCLWIPGLIGQLTLNRTSWLDPPEVVFWLQVLANFTSGIFYHTSDPVVVFGAILFGSFFFAGLVEFFPRPNAISMKFFYTYQNMFLLIFFFVPIFIPFVLSFFKPMLYEGKRYLIFLLPLFFIIVARGICSLKNIRIISAIVIAVLCVNLMSLRCLYTKTQKRYWNKTSMVIKKYSKPDDAVLSTDYSEGRILSYYGYGNAKWITIKQMRVWKKILRPYKRLWFIAHIPNSTEERFFDQVLKRIKEHTFTCDEGYSLKIILYDCSNL